MADEVSFHLARARSGRGSPTDVRERTASIGWLLDHADAAYPRVLALAADADADAGLIDLLGRFRRPESTSVLVAAFRHPDPVRRVAAAGLGMSPDPAAREALEAAIADGDHDKRVAALGGLAASDDPQACGDVVPHLEDVDAEVRWMAVHAAARLGCIGDDELRAIADSDADPDVRALAAGHTRV